MNQVRLIIGGARSGKSSLAEQYAAKSKLPVIYLATGQARDIEMQYRISQHQAQRPKHWQLIEAPLLLAQAIESAVQANNESTDGVCILVDCLTLWLSNCLCDATNVSELSQTEHNDNNNLAYWQNEKQQFLSLLANIQSDLEARSLLGKIELILVSNEVGHGIVPMGTLSRQFVDQAGWLHQAIAEIADDVEFVMAGLPLVLKQSQHGFCEGDS